MSGHDDITARLPGPYDGEPPDLRRDIADEIADHLACATARETRRGGDETLVRKRVLERFGDPQRVVRRLWLDAMKEAVMRQKLLLGTNLLLTVTCVALCVIAFMALRQNAKLGESLLTRMQEMQAAPTGSVSIWAETSVQITRRDGSVVPDVTALLAGQPFNVGTGESVPGTMGDGGVVRFGPVRPGRYDLRANVAATGLSVTKEVTLYPGRQELEPIIWPESATPEEPAVVIDTDWPADLDETAVAVLITLNRSPLDPAPSSAWSWSTTAVVVRRDGAVMPEGELDRVGRGWRLPTDLTYSRSVPLDASFTYRVKSLHMLIASGSPSIVHKMPLRSYAAPPPRDPNRIPNPDVRRRGYYDALELLRVEPEGTATTWRIELPDWFLAATRMYLARERSG